LRRPTARSPAPHYVQGGGIGRAGRQSDLDCTTSNLKGDGSITATRRTISCPQLFLNAVTRSMLST